MKEGALLSSLEETDPQIAALLEREKARQEEGLELIASENFTSRAVLEAMGSVLTNKYAEGYAGRRYYGGCEVVDEVETAAIDRVKALFGAEYANVQPHSGAQANMAVYHALLKPGDTVLGMSLAAGGHLTHGSAVNFSGQLYRFVPYGVDAETERLDLDQLTRLARAERPKLIVAGASAYPLQFDFVALRRVADEVGALLMVDMAHIAGLVATGLHPSPVGVAQVVTSTTHKTLRGPRGGFILADAQFGPAIDKAVFPGIQGGPLMHVIAAKAVAFLEASQEPFARYQAQVVQNARCLAESLVAAGWQLVGGGSENHMLIVKLLGRGLTGAEAERALGMAAITVNKNAIPNDPLPPRQASGIRMGTPALTSRGITEEAIREIAGLIDQVLTSPHDPEVLATAAQATREIARAYPLYQTEQAR